MPLDRVLRVCLFTFLISGLCVLANVVVCSLTAYAFARLRFPGRDFLFYAFLLQLMLVPPALIVSRPY